MTPLGLLNFLVCQWFGFRVAKCYDIEDADIQEFALMPDGSIRTAWLAKNVTPRYTIMARIVPLTGWWSDYRTF